MEKSHVELVKKRLFGSDGYDVTNFGLSPGDTKVTPDRMAQEVNNVLYRLENGDYETINILDEDNYEKIDILYDINYQ